MSSHIEDLPDEMLLLILQHLRTSSLVYTIPYVSVRWRRLSLDAQLWRGRIVDERWSSNASAVRFFSRGPSLDIVSFRRRRVGGTVLRCIAHRCPSLTMLILDVDQCVNLRTLRAVATGLVHLRHLELGEHVLSCPRTARVVATLMPSLETLILWQYKYYCEPRLRELAGGCPSLRRLDLDTQASLYDLGPELLGRLRRLTCSWELLTHDVVLCLASLQEIKLYHYISGNFRSDAALPEDVRTLTALTRVHASFFDGRNGSRVLVEALLQQPTLRALTLTRCPMLDDALLRLVCRRCPLMEDLNVSRCDGITALGLSELWRLQGLRRLNLGGCVGLGGGAAEHLARCQGLQHLDIGRVDLRSLEPGALRLLELHGMRELTLNAWSARDLIPWEELPEAFPYLRVLDLGEWMSLDTTLLERLKAALPRVRVRWDISWELRERRRDEADPEDPDEAEPEEPDLDLFIFREN